MIFYLTSFIWKFSWSGKAYFSLLLFLKSKSSYQIIWNWHIIISFDNFYQFWETYVQVRKQQLELDMEQQTSSK